MVFASLLVLLFASFRRSSRLSFRPSTRFLRFVVRPVPSFRSSVRFLRFVPRPAFRFVSRFVSPFGRVGWAVCGSRRFCQLFGVGGRLCFLCPGAVVAMCRHVVSLMGGGGWCGGAYGVPCGGAWGVLLGEALGGE